MHAIYKKIFFVCLILAIAGNVGFGKPRIVQAFGLAPSNIIVSSILHNSTQTKRFTIFRGVGEEGDVRFHIEPKSPNGQFIVNGAHDVIMKADQDHVDDDIQINPGTAPNGTYRVELVITKIDSEEVQNKTPVKVVSGAIEVIEVHVTGDVMEEFRFLQVAAEDVEVYKPIRLHYVLNNLGNVDWRPGMVECSFTKVGEIRPQETIVVSGLDLAFVPAGSPHATVEFTVPNQLTEGRYIPTLTFFAKGERVGALTAEQAFRIVPEGMFTNPGELSSFSTDKNTYRQNEEIRVTADFTNTGNEPLTGAFYLTSVIGSDVTDYPASTSQTVAPGQQVQFSRVLSFGTKGDYELRGYVEYAKKRTKVASVRVIVNEKGDEKKPVPKSERALTMLNSPIGLGIITVLIAGITISVARRKKKTL